VRKRPVAPNSINHLCSLTEKWNSEIFFPNRSYKYVKSCSYDLILQNLILCTRSCGPGFITQPNWFFIFTGSIWSGGNVLSRYHSCTSSEGTSRGGQSLNVFTWFIGAGGLSNFSCATLGILRTCLFWLITSNGLWLQIVYKFKLFMTPNCLWLQFVLDFDFFVSTSGLWLTKEIGNSRIIHARLSRIIKTVCAPSNCSWQL